MTEQPTVHPVAAPPAAAQPTDFRRPDTFEYPTEGGTIVVPKFKRAMSIGFIRQNRKLSEDDMMFTLLEQKCSAEALALIDTLDLDAWGNFVASWQDDSGIKPGESLGS